MIHMNQQPRYQRIYEDLITVYTCRGTHSAHFIAGMAIGYQIAKGINEVERENLANLFQAARYAK